MRQTPCGVLVSWNVASRFFGEAVYWPSAVMVPSSSPVTRTVACPPDDLITCGSVMRLARTVTNGRRPGFQDVRPPRYILATLWPSSKLADAARKPETICAGPHSGRGFTGMSRT